MEHFTHEFVDGNGHETFEKHNGMELEQVDRDYAVIRMTVQPESKNFYGTVHGGALYTMADCAAGIAVLSNGKNYLTQNGTLHFVRSQTAGEIRATAHVRYRGKTTALAAVDVTGEEGRLLASGTFTFFCTDKPEEKEAE